MQNTKTGFGTLDLPGGRKNIRLFDEYPLTTWFDNFNPTFDFEKNLDAQDYMITNAIWWIKEFNIDGFRLDAVKHVPHSFWVALRKKIREEIEIPQNKTFYMVGESISSREKIMEYVNAAELDGQFDFPLYWAIRDAFAWETQGYDRLESELKASQKIYKNGLMSNILGNQDFTRFATLANGDVKPNSNDKDEKIIVNNDSADTYNKLKLAWTFIMTNPGLPMIYYGDEIGLPGKGDPNNRRMMLFNIDNSETDLLNYISKLTKIRQDNPALRSGINKTLFVEKDIYGYKLSYFNNEVIIILNRSGKTISKSLDLNDDWQNAFTGQKQSLKSIEINPRSALILTRVF